MEEGGRTSLQTQPTWGTKEVAKKSCRAVLREDHVSWNIKLAENITNKRQKKILHFSIIVTNLLIRSEFRYNRLRLRSLL